MRQRDTLRAIAVVALLAIAYAAAPRAQQKALTLEEIYGSGSRRLEGKFAAALSFLDNPWIDDAHYLWPGDDPANPLWLTVDALSGKAEPFYDPKKVVVAFATLPGISEEQARSVTRRRPTNFNPKHDAFIVTIEPDLFVYDILRNIATRLTASDEEKELATFSPDGRSVAYIGDDNLYVVDVAGGHARAMTSDGSPDLLNGKLDWVYSEELYGRGHYRAYWWSPDSSAIAFLQLDEKQVPTYTLFDDIPYRPGLTTFRYPKAGDPNPIVKLGAVSVTGGDIRWIDTSKYSDFLIVNVGWTPDSRSLIYQVQDRKQTWLDVNTAGRANGLSTTLFRETSNTWVRRWDDSSANIVWLKDGSFLWLSERSGFRHLYRYKADGELIRQVTDGTWEVRSVERTDEPGGWIYFSSTARSVIGTDVFRVNTYGGSLQRLTMAAGTHRACFNPSGYLYLDSWSDVSTPPRVTLHRADGSQVRVIEPNPVPALRDYKLSAPQFVQVKARDGFVMEAMMIKPPDFNASKRYPVYQYVYGGPHQQLAVNEWGSSNYFYHQMLAAHGVIVWICDSRTASGKGAASEWPVYSHFGDVELRDIEDCAGWLKKQPYVDGSRIGIYGYSFGGFMAAYALTHPSSFTMGIAAGAVTDWRNYDTIYTERYMGLPEENPDGYRDSSPRFSAENLHGDLLLIHDTGDDNVHPQNALQFAFELQKAGKLFQMMLYPGAGHGIADIQLLRHERQVMLDFTLKSFGIR